MLYTIYQVTHRESGKCYIGKHKTEDLNDGYMGSGQLIRRAIKKHSIEAFEKEVLHVFKTEEEMNLKEAELVTEEFCLREDTYNICPGGHGGWGYVNSKILDSNARKINGSIGGKSAKILKKGIFSDEAKQARAKRELLLRPARQEARRRKQNARQREKYKKFREQNPIQPKQLKKYFCSCGSETSSRKSKFCNECRIKLKKEQALVMSRSYQNRRFITNGLMDKLIPINSPLPEGFSWGRSQNKKVS